MFNEMTIMTVGFHLIMFTDFLEDTDKRYIAGFSAIIATTLNILVNAILIIWMNYSAIKGKLL
jgi:hypothetical protein